MREKCRDVAGSFPPDRISHLIHQSGFAALRRVGRVLTRLSRTLQWMHDGCMPRYTRAWVPGGTFFFTVALLERRRTLLTDHVEILRAAFRRTRQSLPFEIDAIVILPDHFHTIWTLPADDADFSTRMRFLKTLFSRAIPTTERRSARRLEKHERGIWQRRFWEHSIQDEADLKRHMNYIHYNPVKHGCVARVRDWPYSSFHRHVGAGLYPMDWAGVAGGVGDERE